MTLYWRLLKMANARLLVNENGEEMICFYPEQLKRALELEVAFEAMSNPIGGRYTSSLPCPVCKESMSTRAICQKCGWGEKINYEN